MDHPDEQDALARYPTEVELAFTASAAALALDQGLRGKQIDLSPVLRLIRVLGGRLQLATTGRRRGLLDPMTAEFFRRALVVPEENEQSVKAIRDAAQAFLDRLSKAGKEPTVDLAELRDTCVALSQSAQASLATFREGMPSHPYRR